MVKSELLKCRCTPAEKSSIEDYAKDNKCTISEALRKVISKYKEDRSNEKQ